MLTQWMDGWVGTRRKSMERGVYAGHDEEQSEANEHQATGESRLEATNTHVQLLLIGKLHNNISIFYLKTFLKIHRISRTLKKPILWPGWCPSAKKEAKSCPWLSLIPLWWSCFLISLNVLEHAISVIRFCEFFNFFIQRFLWLSMSRSPFYEFQLSESLL